LRRKNTVNTIAALKMDKLDLSDEENEDLWASPSRATNKSSKSNSKSLDSTNTSASLPGESQYDAEHAREEALQKELQGVRSINEVIEGVISSLERAKGNMDVGSLHLSVIES
jgi:DASH complex subunit Duo1